MWHNISIMSTFSTHNADIIRMISDGFEKAKSGEALAEYHRIAPLQDSGDLPPKSHYAYGWILYYALHQSIDSDIMGRKQILARYLKLEVPRPHKLHSMILGEAIRLYKNYKSIRKSEVAFSILRFVRLWDAAHLREGDWRRKTLDGKRLPALVEKLITATVDECVESSRLPESSLMHVIDKALLEWPDAYTLLAQRAELYILSGDRENAISMLRKSIAMAPAKFFLWSRLASLYDITADLRRKIALLYRALISPGPEQFKGRIRLSLAEALMSRKLYNYALWELERVKQIYTSGEWHLPPSAERMLREIPADTRPENPESLYQKVAHLADEELTGDLPWISVTKTYHKGPEYGEGNRGYSPMTVWRVSDCQGNHYWFAPGKFGLQENLPLRSKLSIKSQNGRVIKASMLPD